MKDKMIDFSASIHPKIIIDPSPITLERLHEAYIIVAKVIKHHGSAYLPIFEKLKNEIEKMEKNKQLLTLAEAVANND